MTNIFDSLSVFLEEYKGVLQIILFVLSGLLLAHEVSTALYNFNNNISGNYRGAVIMSVLGLFLFWNLYLSTVFINWLGDNAKEAACKLCNSSTGTKG